MEKSESLDPLADSDEKIHRRIKLAIESKSLPMSRFAEKAGMKYRSVRDYALGERKPGFQALSAIIRFSGVSSEWLLMGQGPMFLEDHPTMGDVDESLMGVIARDIGIFQYKLTENRLHEDADEDGSYSLEQDNLKKTIKRAASNTVLAAGVYNRVVKIADPKVRKETIAKEIETLVRMSHNMEQSGDDF